MDKSEVLKVFPEIDLIGDENLKDVVIKSYMIGSELGEWDKKGGFANCPVAAQGLMRDGCDVTGIWHMRTVAQTADRVLKCLGPWFAKMGYEPDYDFCVGGALLHDVGKLIEFDRDSEGRPCYSSIGKMFCHTSAGAYIVKQAGGSDEMVHMVLTHSYQEAPEGYGAFEKPEHVIVKGCDGACFEQILVAWAMPGKELKI